MVSEASLKKANQIVSYGLHSSGEEPEDRVQRIITAALSKGIVIDDKWLIDAARKESKRPQSRVKSHKCLASKSAQELMCSAASLNDFSKVEAEIEMERIFHLLTDREKLIFAFLVKYGAKKATAHLVEEKRLAFEKVAQSLGVSQSYVRLLICELKRKVIQLAK